jgi:acetoin utilization deacetylase AcuC-like enzyme
MMIPRETIVELWTSPDFVNHDTGLGHPERPDRIRAISRAVREAGLITTPDPFPDFRFSAGVAARAGLRVVEQTAEETEIDNVRLAHSQSHVRRVLEACSRGGALDDGDTVVGSRSLSTSLRAVGAVLAACDSVAGGLSKRAFCVVRPPGHHAEPDRPMGFCLWNNVAIGARHLQHTHGVGKIAIVDFDVHHGNGTQACFYDDGSVLFISTHQHPSTCYPGTGFEEETGTGSGLGTTVNIPLQPGEGDEELLKAMRDRVIPAVERFKPEILMLSAGFDAHQEDPLAQLNVSDAGFEALARELVSAARSSCNGRIVSVLEGGYNLTALARCAAGHLAVLAEPDGRER